MSEFTFRSRTAQFDMRDFVLGFLAFETPENGGQLSYVTAGSQHDIELFGAGLGPSGLPEAPISGTIDRFEIDLLNNGSTNPDVVIDTDPAIMASLIPSGDDFDENELLWRALLKGQTTFNFEGGRIRIDILGDFRTADGETITRGNGFNQAGDDLFLGTGGDGAFPRGDGDFVVNGASVEGGHDQFTGVFDTTFGDVFGVTDATLFGGDDVYTETAQFSAGSDVNVEFVGDATAVTGTSTVEGGDDSFFAFAGSTSDYIFRGDVTDVGDNVDVTGGDDTFIVGGTGRADAFGDANAVTGVVTGGDDLFTTETTKGFQGVAVFYGDVHTVSDGGQLTGGHDTLVGGTGNDLLYGDAFFVDIGTVEGGNDSLVGGDGDDALFGDVATVNDLPGVTSVIGGADTLRGGLGADTLNGGTGTDWAFYDGAAVSIDLFAETASGGQAEGDVLSGIENLRGTAGNDTLRGNFQTNVLEGGDGNDSLIALAGGDTLRGGDGNDTLVNGVSVDGTTFDGGAGIDTLILESGLPSRYSIVSVEHAIIARTGSLISSSDLLSFQSVDVREAGSLLVSVDQIGAQFSQANFVSVPDDFFLFLIGTEADDSFIGSALGENMRGSSGNDTIDGGAGDDTIYGEVATLGLGDGNDLLLGGDGDDSVFGRNGDDDLRGGLGDDTLGGDDGADFVRGNRGQDMLTGGMGDDSLRGQRDGDSLDGGDGNDNLKGGGGNDTVIGGDGDDFVKGGSRRDSLYGDAGNDSLAGNSFDDLLDGGSGNDRLLSGGDNDTLIGGSGDDFLRGGTGNDTFIFAVGDGQDTIDDFDVDADTLIFVNQTLTAQQIEDIAVVEDGELVIAFSASDIITLSGVTTNDGLAEAIQFLV